LFLFIGPWNRQNQWFLNELRNWKASSLI
jgi:hypothetical protein